MKTWSTMQEATNAEILAWARSQPWARAMAACPQDPQWHAEGDVWTHTQMVCAELEQAEEWLLLDRCSQLRLLFTGLFHDAGKPATTALDPEAGRIRSPNHSQASAQIARQVLRDLGCDLALREEIARLIRFHSRPPYLLEKPNPEREVISLSWLVNNRLLYLFAIADTRGRKAEEMARPEEQVHLWKSLAEEHGCFGQPYAFANDQARFLFYRDRLTSLHYKPHENYRCTVTLMSGLPGAGKDTWLARHHPQLPVVSLDAVREDLDTEATDNQGKVIQTARERCRQHLRAEMDFAFNATNITRQVRRRWIDLFADYGARIEIAYLEPELATVFARNKRRKHPVPEKVILDLSRQAEPPTATECHRLAAWGATEVE